MSILISCSLKVLLSPFCYKVICYKNMEAAASLSAITDLLMCQNGPDISTALLISSLHADDGQMTLSHRLLRSSTTHKNHYKGVFQHVQSCQNCIYIELHYHFYLLMNRH